ncbi:MAG TPA: 50S ribosomal protein L18 [Candidatus Omnitrophota bacterium]|jgi:large subunit ribosomal protein L18|nr:50S ribosomal protein L18 [Candidatus Omnitrophota bacterium]
MGRNEIVKESKRLARHIRIRKRVVGTSARPRLCIHRSLKNFAAQIIDDSSGKVLFGLSTKNQTIKQKIKSGGNIQAAAALGEVFASELVAKGLKEVCFDRGGYVYHGRVKAFAEAARKSGLEF